MHLPPLPNLGGITTGPSVVDVIAREHRELLALCDRLTGDADGADAAQLRDVAQVLSAGLCRHLSAEEQYLYPAVRDAVPDGYAMVEREIAEDRAILEALRLLEAADDGNRAERSRDVHRRLRRHAEAAAGELLPLLERMAGAEDLIRLGNRVQLSEEAAPTRPHPATPLTPPWNKVIDPAVALLDKARDVVSGRTTYPQDL
jgi:hypothetical protein